MPVKKYKWTEQPKTEPKQQIEQPKTKRIKSIWHTRLVLNGVITGNRYEFQPGEVKEVDAKDFHYFLEKTKIQKVCCGGMKAQPLKYFSEVE